MSEEEKKENLKQKIDDCLNTKLNSLLEKFQKDIETLETLKYNYYENCIIKYNNYTHSKNGDIKEESEEIKEEKTEDKKEEKIEENKEEEQKEEITNKGEGKVEKKEHIKKIEPKKDNNSMRSKTPVKTSMANKNKRIKEDKSKDIMNKTIAVEKKNLKDSKKDNKDLKKDISKDKLDNKGLKSGLSKDKFDNNKALKLSKTKATAGFKRNSVGQTKNEKKYEKELKDKKKSENKKKETKEETNKTEEKNEEEKNEKEEEEQSQPKKIEIKPAYIYNLPENIKQNNSLSAIYMMLEKKFLPIKNRFNIITSNLNLYKDCYNSDIKFLLHEQIKFVENSISSIEKRFKNYSEKDLKTYLTKEFVPSKVAQNSLTFLTKEEEKNLSEKTNLPNEIKYIFQVVYYLLDVKFDKNKPASFLIKHLLNEVCSENKVKDLKNLIINYYNKHKHLNLSPEKFNNIEKVIKENPKILNNKELAKINRPISYLAFYINEAYKYMNLKATDGLYYYQVRHMNELLHKYKEDIKKMKKALGIEIEDDKKEDNKIEENKKEENKKEEKQNEEENPKEEEKANEKTDEELKQNDEEKKEEENGDNEKKE